jgi:replicative DNA helicase
MSKGNTSPKNKQATIASNEFKMPPKALEAEGAVLGAILLERDAIDRVIDILTPDTFYSESNKLVFKAILNLYAENAAIETITVMNKLKKNGDLEAIGGAYYLTKLTGPVVSSANIELHARIIQQKFIKRQMAQLSSQIHNASYDESQDDLDVIELAEKEIFKITNGLHKRKYATIEGLMVDFFKRTEALRANESDLVGVPTGFPRLDTITHGWRPTDLIILAARPSVGKTAFAINLARNAATHPDKPTKVAIFSLEMSAAQLVDRLVSMSTDIPLDYILTGKMDDSTMQRLYQKGTQSVAKIPIFIDDTGGINIFELRGKARTLVKKEGVGMIIIDYLQLMSGVSGDKAINSREQEISHISRNLKALAKELSIPIIALSQLSRKIEERKVKDPMLSDLRESGAIEQDADLVMFLHRPEYYGVTADEHGESTKGTTLLNIAKHRNGILETVTLRANLSIQKFFQEEAMYRPSQPPPGSGNWKSVNQEDDYSPF